MPKAIDLTPDFRFMGLFVGESGTGKTVAAASFPKPVEFLDFDGRIRGLLGASWIDRKEINYEFFPPKDLGIVDKVNKKLEYYEIAKSMNQSVPISLVLDSLTSECFAMVQQSLSLTHKTGGKDQKKVGRYLGSIAMTGPEDYGFEAQATYQIMSFLRTLPIPNIIVSAHIIKKWGKLDPDNPYADSVIIGEQLSVRDKIGENIQIYFDHVFRFYRRGNEHFVKFKGDLARTSYADLPEGEHNITGKNFYEFMMSHIKRPVVEGVKV